MQLFGPFTVFCSCNAGAESKDSVATLLDSAVAEQLATTIHQQADVLLQSWNKTNERFRDWQQQILSTKQASQWRK